MKKRALTLIEVMIVILLIALITGVVGYNMKGSLDRGKKFKTDQAKERLLDLLSLCVAEGADPEKVVKSPEDYLKKLGLVKEPKTLLVDGWNRKFVITYNKQSQAFEIAIEDSK